MGNKILAIHGSPRKNGNSIFLAKQAIEVIKKTGKKVDEIFLNDLNIKFCRGCEACRKDIKGRCAIKDDMQKLYDKVIEADTILLSSPIYWFSISAQLKTFFDRLYAIHTDSITALKDKKIGVVLTYADVDPVASGAVNAIRMFQDIAGYADAKIIGMVYGTAVAPGDAKKNRNLVKKARELGKTLAEE